MSLTEVNKPDAASALIFAFLFSPMAAVPAQNPAPIILPGVFSSIFQLRISGKEYFCMPELLQKYIFP